MNPWLVLRFVLRRRSRRPGATHTLSAASLTALVTLRLYDERGLDPVRSQADVPRLQTSLGRLGFSTVLFAGLWSFLILLGAKNRKNEPQYLVLFHRRNNPLSVQLLKTG
jgi:hypothetical protein